MLEAKRQDVTEHLLAWSAGDAEALAKLMPLVNQELRQVAGAFLARERSDHTLQPTALVNELYLRLVDRRKVRWQSRAQFFAFAAKSMRRILVDHARGHRASKRGSGATKISLDDAIGMSRQQEVSLIALDDALRSLAERSPQQSQIIELRCFGGLSLEETASVLGIGSRSVSRAWTAARAWLFRELKAD